MDLYALPPEEFTAARDAAVKQAKADGDKPLATALGALRRPTASAHAVNALVRAEPDLLAQLLELGQSLAQAQRDGEADDLKALGAQRRQLVEAVADQAAVAAGKALGAAARTEVVSTLEAALADSASGEAVRTGRLVRALSYAGFGEVDLDGAVAPEPAQQDGPAATDLAEKKAAKELAKQIAAAERRSQHAHGALDDAVRGHERAVRLAEQAALTLETADGQVQRAEEALKAAEDRRREARLGQEKAADELERTTDAVTKAQDEAEQSRTALDELRRRSG